MTNEEILNIAMRQSALEENCSAEDYTLDNNIIVLSAYNTSARQYLSSAYYCNLTSYGNNIVASVDKDFKEEITSYLNKHHNDDCFLTPYLQVLNDELKKKGMCVCYMAEYFLPDINVLTLKKCDYTTRLLYPEDLEEYYLPEWGNALIKDKKSTNELAVGAFDDNGKLIGLAACSSDCESMWQIGIDVLPEYQKKGIASAITSQLALSILQRGKVPFYCAAWSNIASVRNAIKSGFRPSWVQVTAKSIDFVNKANM